MKFALALVFLSSLMCLSLASRSKRFSTFGTGLSTVGGHLGCVVSENKLFINGRYTKELNDAEQGELEEYKKTQEQFREEVKAFIEERQKQFRLGGARAENDSKSAKKPEPPKKPSFCSDKATTQYVFDGCSVQGDAVYIGNNFVRKLTPAELEELEQFDKQFSSYQKAVSGQFRKQVEEIFGRHFGSLFEGTQSSSKSTEVAQPSEVPPENAAKTPEAPKTPNFCTLIV